MKVLFDAIVARYKSVDGVALRLALGANLYLQHAPHGTEMPFLTYDIEGGGESVDYSMKTDVNDGGKYRTVVVNFRLWDDDKSPLAILNAGEVLRDLYDDVLLTVADGWTVFLASQITAGLEEDFASETKTNVITYEYQVGKER